LYRVGAADAAFLLGLPNGMNGHDPKNGDAEVFEVIKALLDTAEISVGGEGARIHLINDRRSDPVSEPGCCGLLGGGGEQESKAQGNNGKQSTDLPHGAPGQSEFFRLAVLESGSTFAPAQRSLYFF